MTRQERIQLLKNTLKNRHLSFYTDDHGELKRYDIISNKKWINSNIDKEWRNCEDNIFAITGFDFVSMSLVEIISQNVIWDELNEYYDNCPDYLKRKIKTCEDTLNFISDSWWDAQDNKNIPKNTNKKTFKIYKKSEKRKNSSYYSFELCGIHYSDRYFVFDDVINDNHYHILIPSKYIAEYCRINCRRNYGIIHQKYILNYIEGHQNTI